MNLIERYIGKAVLQSTAIVLLVLLALNSIIVFVEELGDVGQGDYTTLEAAIYVVLTLPYKGYQFFAVSVLLGCLFGVGNMAVSSELTVLRATGWSLGKIIWAVCKTTLLMMLLAFMIGEWLAPKAEQFAENRRSWLISGGQLVRSQNGVWAKDHNAFVNIETIRDTALENITLYQLDPVNGLQYILYAKTGQMGEHRWRLYDVQKTEILAERTQSQQLTQLDWDTELSAQKLGLLSQDAELMDLPSLYEYRQYLKRNGQKTHIHDFIFWQKVWQPLATLVMTLLAMAFIFGPLRSGTFGSRLVLGLILGFAFNIANKIIGEVSAVWELPAFLVAAIPSCVFLGFAYYLIRRQS